MLRGFKVISYIYDLHICTYNNHLHLNSISPEERFAALTGHGSEIKSEREISTDLTDLFSLVVCRFLIRFGLFRNWIFFESLMRHYRLQGTGSSTESESVLCLQQFEDKKIWDTSLSTYYICNDVKQRIYLKYHPSNIYKVVMVFVRKFQ